MKTFSKFVLRASLGCIISTLIVGCDGLEEQKHFKTNIVAGDATSWIQRGAKDADLTAMEFTNKSGDHRFRYQTNVIVNGISYETIIRFESAEFKGRGYLVAARNGTVIWIGTNGQQEVTFSLKH